MLGFKCSPTSAGFGVTTNLTDISYAVSVASRYMDQPHEIHWKATKRILNFVQGTRTHGIFYKAKYDLDLIGFTDSDWALCWVSNVHQHLQVLV